MEKITLNLSGEQLEQERKLFEARILQDENERLHHDLVMGVTDYGWFYMASMFQGWLAARYGVEDSTND